MRIAIVEDNRALAGGIAKALRVDGHGVDELHDGSGAAQFLLGERVDLIILDVNLPGISGLEILRTLRGSGDRTPVLMLTARDSLHDKVSALDFGADDYLTKPFELEELLARTRALLRRSDKEFAAIHKLGDIEFNVDAKTLTICGHPVDLPRREFALFEALLKSRGGVVSKARILDHLYGTGADVEESAVELYVHRLRKKLGGSGTEIKTIRGLGYCLRTET